MSLSEMKSQVLQFLATQYPVSLEMSLLGAPQEVAGIHVIAGQPDGEANVDLGHLTGGLKRCSRTNIGGDYGLLYEDCSVFSKLYTSSVTDLLSLLYVSWRG